MKNITEEEKINRKIMFQIYRVNWKGKRAGYSSDSNYEYVKNKGIEPYEKIKIDSTHEFMAHPGKGSVEISIYYRGDMIDTDAYMKRHKNEMLEA